MKEIGNVTRRVDDQLAFNVHHTFTATLDAVACAIHCGGTNERLWTRGRALYATRAMFYSHGTSVPAKWQTASENAKSEARQVARSLFRELASNGDCDDASKETRDAAQSGVRTEAAQGDVGLHDDEGGVV